MTDLEITKLCVEASGLPWRTSPFSHEWPYVPCAGFERDTSDDLGAIKAYEPLHNDAQCMALVKRFQLQIQPPWCRANKDWRVGGKHGPASDPHGSDLNRAICECVARMQASK